MLPFMRGMILCAAVGVLAFVSPAFAQESAPDVVRVRFTSTAQPYAVEAAACALPPFFELGRPIDVRVGDRRCSSSPASEDAIALVVRVEPSEASRVVVLEAPAVDVDDAGMATIGRVLRSRIVDGAASVSLVARPRTMLATLSPALRDAGVTLMILGAVAGTIGAVGCGFVHVDDASVNGAPDHDVATALLSTLGVGAGLLVIGLPLWIIGRTKVLTMASVSPHGGALRLTF
jgi:hypothetical protein